MNKRLTVSSSPLLLIALCLLLSRPCSGQWRIIAPNLLGTYCNGAICYAGGCIFASSGSGNALWVSADTGKTWSMRPAVSPITTVDFVTALKGLIIAGDGPYYTSDQGMTWARLGADFVPHPEFDGGTLDKSGSVIILNGSYFTKSGVFHPNVYRSSDLGATWDTIPLPYAALETPVVSKSGKIYDVENQNSYRLHVSTDLGRTWTRQPGIFGGDSWSIATDKCDDNTIYAANEGVGQTSHIYVSSDNGVSFRATITKPGGFFAGSVTTSRNAVYCLSTDSGVYRSTDRGNTWRPIGGPPSHTDTRYICAVNDNIILVADVRGNIWITENSGGDPVIDHSLSASATTFPTLVSCDSMYEDITVSNTCDTVILTSAALTGGSDPSFVLDPRSLPDTLAGNRSRSFRVHFNPHRSAGTVTANLDIRGYTMEEKTSNPTSIVIPISARSEMETPNLVMADSLLEFGTLSTCYRDTAITIRNSGCDTMRMDIDSTKLAPDFFLLTTIQRSTVLLPDSTITVRLRFYPQGKGKRSAGLRLVAAEHGVVRNYGLSLAGTNPSGGIPLSVHSSTLIFDTVSTCHAPVDSILELFNTGCDTITITGGPGALPTEFTVLGMKSLPFNVFPGDTVMLTVRFAPTTSGTVSATTTIMSEVRGIKIDLPLYFSGSGKQEGGVLSYAPKFFNFQSLMICDRDSASGFVTNSGCDSLGLDPASILGDPDFHLSGLTSRIPMRPHDTIHYTIYVNPASKGIRTGNLVLTSHADGAGRRDSIPFRATVTDGTRILSSSLRTIDFGARSVCQEPDTAVELTNSGCDTVVLSEATASGTGFLIQTPFPITILPGHTETIRITSLRDTSGGKTVASQTLTFASNSDNSLLPIRLSRTFLSAPHGSLNIILDPQQQTGGNRSRVVYQLKQGPGQPFSGTGLQTVDLDLHYDHDLLTFDPTGSSANLTSTDGQRFSLHGIPELAADENGVLGNVAFLVHLTKDSSCAIELGNRTDPVSTPCGDLTLAIGGSARFDYSYACGEQTIAQFLNGKIGFSIGTIHPNPAHEELQFAIDAQVPEVARIEVIDWLGHVVFTTTEQLLVGTNIVTVNTRTVPEGVLLLRVNSSTGARACRFLKIQ